MSIFIKLYCLHFNCLFTEKTMNQADLKEVKLDQNKSGQVRVGVPAEK